MGGGLPLNMKKKKKATGKSMDVGQVPGEEGTHALLSLEAKGNSSYLEDGCPRPRGSVGARFPGLQKAQKLQSKTPKDPAVNVRNLVTQGVPRILALEEILQGTGRGLNSSWYYISCHTGKKRISDLNLT